MEKGTLEGNRWRLGYIKLERLQLLYHMHLPLKLSYWSCYFDKMRTNPVRPSIVSSIGSTCILEPYLTSGHAAMLTTSPSLTLRLFRATCCNFIKIELVLLKSEPHRLKQVNIWWGAAKKTYLVHSDFFIRTGLIW